MTDQIEVERTVADARGILDVLIFHVERYKAGEINAATLDAYAYRVHAQLRRACWCGEGVCCEAHREHTTPHMRCMLR